MKKKSTKENRLGRGLSALFQQDQQENLKDSLVNEKETSNDHAIRYIAVSDLYPADSQARKYFDKEKLKELAQSLKNYGVIEPIIVERKDDKWVIIAGERRFRAAKLANLEKIPALVRSQINEEKRTEVMLAENLQRENLTAIEEANAFDEIMKKRSLTQQNLSEIVGKSRSYIANTLRLLKLPQWIQKKISEGFISPSVARSLVVMSEEEQKETMEKIMVSGLNAREVEKRAQISSSKKRLSLGKQQSLKRDLELLEFEKFFREQLKTKVILSPIKKGVGKLTLEYYSYEDLSELLDKLKRN